MSSIIEQSKAAAKIKADLLAGAKASLTPTAMGAKLDALVGSLGTTADHKEEQGPSGSFKNLDLNQFFKADGSKVVPEKGYFIPKDEEEWDLLKFYSTQYNKVTGPKE